MMIAAETNRQISAPLGSVEDISFVIPTEAEGSGVPRTFRVNVFDRA
jgi:hypothetical protein